MCVINSSEPGEAHPESSEGANGRKNDNQAGVNEGSKPEKNDSTDKR